MRRLVVVRSYPQGPRCWVLGQRVHHGSVGVALGALVLIKRGRPAAALGLLLAFHDRRDAAIWFVREGVPAGDSLDSTAVPQ